MPRKKIPHFMLFYDDFMNGTKLMDRGEVGDYIRLLCQIYDEGGAIEFNPGLLRHVLQCRAADVGKRIWRLVELGKLWIDDQQLIHNKRADSEIEGRDLWIGAKSIEANKKKIARLAATCAQLDANLSANTPQNAMNSMGVGTPRARPVPVKKDSSSKLAPSVQAREAGNGSALWADGALGLGGRAPQQWPPPSQLIPRVYPTGKAAAKVGNETALDPLPGAPSRAKETKQ
jgi:uncharacterized protein YdaU (DUF1376 family)